MTLKSGGLARAINTVEFYREIENVWKSRATGKVKNGLPIRIALAVSGGPDSMALAYLCRRLIAEEFFPALKVTAFIVDHRAREKSTEEANKVAGWIRAMGITPKILTLRWPKGDAPRKISNFETLARKLRYQALGKACMAENIPTLFLGHHRDDNVETALLRLSQGHGRFALAGFDSVSPIPECHGIWGVSRSGEATTVEDIRTKCTYETAHTPEHHDSLTPVLIPGPLIAAGGVSLFRPFRQLPKARLEATCLIGRVPFVVDPTNADYTLTARNTVRKLLASNDLPRALQTPSILALVKSCQGAKERLQDLSYSLIGMMQVINFDVQTGTLLIRLPSQNELEKFEKDHCHADSRFPYVKPIDVRLKAVRAIIEMITPSADNQISQEGLLRASQILWPEDVPSSDVFTLGGVHFQPQQQKKTRNSRNYYPYNFRRRSQSALASEQGIGNDLQDQIELNSATPNIWLLSREPFRGQVQPMTEFKTKLPESVPKSSKVPEVNGLVSSEWSTWKLWDNRFWVRVRVKRSNRAFTCPKGSLKSPIYNLGDTIPIVMRPLSQDDVAEIRQQELNRESFKRWHSWKLTDRDLTHRPTSTRAYGSRWNRKAFDVLLTCFAPGHIRKTVPVLSILQSESPAPILQKASSRLSKAEMAHPIARSPGKLQSSEDEEDDNSKYSMCQDGEDQDFDLDNTSKVIALPSFHRRTTKKIWVRMPPAPGTLKADVSAQTPQTLPSTREGQDVNVDYVSPWAIEWEILYKYVDPEVIRRLQW